MNKTWTGTLSGLACCFLFLAWLFPFRFRPWTTIANEMAVFCALLCVSLIIIKLGKPIRATASICLIASLACIPMLQWAFGVIYFFGDALIVDVYLLAFACAVLVGYNLALDHKTQQHTFFLLSVVLAFAGVVSTWVAMRQWLVLQDGDNYLESFVLTIGKRPTGNIGQPNNLATLLCMGLASVLYLFEKRKIGVISSSFLAIFLIGGVALTCSATPWVDVFFLLIWCGWKNQHIKQRLSWRALSCWIGLYALFVICLPLLNGILFQGQSDLFRLTSASARISLWHQFSLAVLNGPLWGYGWNQVPIAQIAASNYFPVPMYVESSHNILIDILIWNGPILGGIIIIYATIWLSRLAYKARSLESSFALLAVSFVLIHGMLELPLHYAFFLLPVGFMLGLTYGEQHQLSAPKRAPMTFSISVFAIALFLGTLLMVRITQEYIHLEKNRNVQLPKELQTKYIPRTTTAANQTFLLTQFREALRVEISTPAPNMTSQQLDNIRKVAHRFPSPAHLCLYAVALALNDQPKQAIQELQYIKIYFGENTYNYTAEKVILLQQQLYVDHDQKSQ